MVRDRVPQSPGVYLVYAKQDDGTWKVRYVGQSDNLERRLLEHLSSREPNACLRRVIRHSIPAVRWTAVEKRNLDGVESYLYRTYSPKCNEVAPTPGGCSQPAIGRLS